MTVLLHNVRISLGTDQSQIHGNKASLRTPAPHGAPLLHKQISAREKTRTSSNERKSSMGHQTSLSDSSSESVVQDGNPQNDIWLTPQDARRADSVHTAWSKLWDGVVIGASLLTLTFGVGVLLWHDWATAKDSFVYWYVVASLTIEFGCLAITGVGMLLIGICLGRTGLAHALSAISIVNEVLFCLAYMTTAIWGGMAIYHMLEDYNYDIKRYVHTNNGQDISWDRVPLLVYVLFSFLVSCVYTLSAIPGFIGIIHFAVHQVKNHFEPSIVSFYRQYNRGDEFYVRVMPVDDLADYVTRMQNPLSTHSAAPQSRDTTHGEDEKRRLLNAGVEIV
eukprot:Blabericola_migrator_1__494@NODE_111_length_13907_cov_66_898049_g99_i0_p4_GENE_NODE_111_length_13907_cov_66_898049_g99_i0NODE_111_length_13907_cov_66_898049_g99_i0_p4_ORF_typecomplete_len335_score39_35DUF588/PF04535_12/89DUF588/PF04535_12/2_8SAYSvFN/PF10260_9/0_21SAYSvFN/PF10260_9/1_5e04DctQ/PF04290_12/50DctQ/PF04290_12/1_2_NODE_111_length_13907_cov_66_898049_g99_i034694473